MKKLMLFPLIALFFCRNAWALEIPSPSVIANIQLQMPMTLSIGWDPMDPGESVLLTNKASISMADVDRGYTDGINGGTLIVNSSMGWYLTVSADSDYFTGGDGAKVISDMFVDLNNAGTYGLQLAGGSNATLFASLDAAVGQTIKLKYKILWNPDDAVGTYETNLYFTLYASI